MRGLHVFSRKKCSPCGFQTFAVSHARTLVENYRRRQWRHQSNPPSRRQARTRDRAVTAGALSHGTTGARGCRLTACARTSPPARSIWPRWRASVHSSAGGALRTRIAKQVRATLDVTHLLCTPTRASRTPFHVPSASRFFAAVARTPLLLGHPVNTSRGGGLCVKKH